MHGWDAGQYLRFADERTLPAMMATYGADRFFWASDYPHPDHTGDYLQALEQGGLPEQARRAFEIGSRLLGEMEEATHGGV